MKATNHCVRFGHSLWSVNQLPAQEGEQNCHRDTFAKFRLVNVQAKVDDRNVSLCFEFAQTI